MLVSGAITSAEAQGLSANQGASANASLVGQYNSAKAAYGKAIATFNDMRKNFITARDAFNKNKGDSTASITAAQNFLSSGADAVINYLTMIKAKATEVSLTSAQIAEINSDISWMQTEKAKIPTLTTKDQLTAEANVMKDHWAQIRLNVKNTIGQILITKINASLTEADKVSADLSTRIATLKAQGKDTSSLEALLADANSKITLAKQQRDLAVAKFNTIGGTGTSTADLNNEINQANSLISQGQAFVNQANTYVRAAYADYKNIIVKMKAMGGTSTVTGTGTVTGNGTGTALIKGSGTVTASAGIAGTITVVGTSTVTTTGTGTVTNPNPTTAVYTGYGSITVSGSNLMVTIQGTSTTFTVNGTGTMTLTGTGTYKSSKGTGSWASTGTTISL